MRTSALHAKKRALTRWPSWGRRLRVSRASSAILASRPWPCSPVSPSCSSAYTFYNVRTTYDADGNQIGLQTLSLSDGTVVRTDTFTINSTAQVCI